MTPPAIHPEPTIRDTAEAASMPEPARRAMPNPAVVVIGRNEGERLERCLRSVLALATSGLTSTGHLSRRIVYVDSGSTDGSVDLARSLGAEVVALDMSKPFSAARGRNAGLTRLLELDPAIAYVQFVDGDCEVLPGWLEAAVAALEADPRTAAVCGRLRERFPEASIYNALCDAEWDAPPGVSKACGGNAMYRVSALLAAGSFNPTFISGEEPELCYRLRRAGHLIRRLPHDMALHDADMHTFRQWWKRAARGGYGLALGAALHGRGPERYNVKRILSDLFWAIALPAAIIVWPVMCVTLGRWLLPPGVWIGALTLVLPMLYLYRWLWVKMALAQTTRGRSKRVASIVARFTLLAKFAEIGGLLRFVLDRLTKRPPNISDFEAAPRTLPRPVAAPADGQRAG